MDATLATANAESKSALDIAARSIMDSCVAGPSLADVVVDRTLDHLWDGIFQHIALRVGAHRASELLAELEHEMEDAVTQPHVEPEGGHSAGPRAALYRRIRRLLQAAPIALAGPGVSPWWRPRDAQYRRQLDDFRRSLAGELSSLALEIVELRFARGLSLVEVAAVLDATLPEVEQVCARVWSLAERHFGRRPGSHDRTLLGSLRETLALDTRRASCTRRRRHQPVLALGTVIADRYEVEALLGAGAFADVYRARDREVTDHIVAVKILRVPSAEPSSVRTALRELQLIASVFHPSIVQLKDHGWHAGRLWFVMPLYRGETLAERVSRGPLTRREAREIFEPLAEGLATMHRAGVLHQDIKPDNVFLAKLDLSSETDPAKVTTRRILPVLLDLGVAAKDAELVLAGTPAYFAPEVAARFAGAPDPAPVGPKADVFALALTLRHALDPRRVEEVAGGSVDAFVAFRATHVPRPPVRGDLADLRAPFSRWLSFAPDQRPSAEELRRELSVLTLPEERRARRLALMRWAVPSAVALFTLFVAVVSVLSHEASLQRTQAAYAKQRADQAGQRAAQASASLTVQQARRRQLEADVARLQTEYQSSRLTREQLAGRLAQTESQLAALTDRQLQQLQRMKQQQDEREHLSAELEDTRATGQELGLKVEHFSAAFDSEHARRAELETRVAALREELEAAHAEARKLEARASELDMRRATWRLLDPAVVAEQASKPQAVDAH